MKPSNKRLFLLSSIFSQCQALAPRTSVQSSTATIHRISPMTPLPILRRQSSTSRTTSTLRLDTDYDTCGFADGKFGLPVICVGRKTFCGTGDIDLDYNFFGCCTGAVTTGTYSPYGCGFSTRCDPYTRRSGVTLSTTDGTTYGVTQCTDSNYPYCLLFTYPTQTMKQWICSDSSTTSSVTMKVQYYVPITERSSTTDKSSSKTSSITTTTSTSDMISSATFTLYGGLNLNPASESQPSSKKGVIGGVLGGIGAVALAILALFSWRRQGKEKSNQATSEEASFKVLGSNIPTSPTQSEKPVDQTPAPPFPAAVEADASDSSNIRHADTRSTSVYQPYRPPSAINQPISHTFYHESEESPSSSLSQIRPYQPYRVDSPDLRPISEVQGSSSFVRSSTPTLPDPSARRDPTPIPAELDGSVSMSTQSGPVPEWR